MKKLKQHLAVTQLMNGLGSALQECASADGYHMGKDTAILIEAFLDMLQAGTLGLKAITEGETDQDQLLAIITQGA